MVSFMSYEKKYNKGNWQKKESPKPYKPKRGKLAPLMKDEDKQKAGIHELSYDFGCRRESKHAQSDNDFLSKMSIAYKEADESDYWLNLLHDNGYLNDVQFNSLSHDCTRIVKILTSIMKTMKAKIEGK